MKANFIKTQNAIIAKILTVLGFSVCTISCVYMYGTPEAEFAVSGKVSDKETQQPLKNIRVAGGDRSINDAVFTNDEGNYQIRGYGDNVVEFQFSDTSGKYNDVDTLLHIRESKNDINTGTLNVQLTQKENNELSDTQNGIN